MTSKYETTRKIAEAIAEGDSRKAQQVGDAHVATLKPWEQERVARYRSDLKTGTYEKADALFWTGVDRPVPMDVFKDAFVPVPSGQQAARTAHNDAFLAEYRKRANEQFERRLEMQAAFGPGEAVVDVITGQRFRT